MIGLEQMNRLREEIDLEIEQTIGYHAVKEFLAEIKEKF